MAFMRLPVAYIRKSTKGGADSLEDQVANVRRFVRPEHQASLLIMDGDWGISASREQQARRLDFLRLMEMVERGEVSHLYAYSADRLARNVGWSARLLDACEDANVAITTGERTFDPRDDSDRQMWHFAAMGNEAEVRKYKRKAADRVLRQRERGQKLGPAYYGDLPGEDRAAVVAAFEATGSAHAAARALNAALERGEDTAKPRRARRWTDASVRQVIRRELRVYIHGKRGQKPRGTFVLSGLLRCHCGHTLSGTFRKHGAPLYRCVPAQADDAHGIKSVSERKILPWVMAEVAHLGPDVDAVRIAADAENRLGEIGEERKRLGLVFARGGIDEATYRAEDDRLVAEAATAEAASIPTIIPKAVDWDWPVTELNAALRAILERIDLGPDMLPVQAVWRYPAWRRP